MKTVKNSFLAIVSMLLLAAAVNPAVSFAAEKGAEQELGNSLSLAYCIPFVGMLLCIAICPLVIGELWENIKR